MQFQRDSDHQEGDQDDDKVKFTDLNVDCMFLIFGHLEFADLLNMAQLNPQMSMLSTAAFRYKYSHLPIVINDDFTLPHKSFELLNLGGVKIDTDTLRRDFELLGLPKKPKTNEKPTFYITETSIHLKSYDAILKTFKYLRPSNTKLRLVYSYDRNVQAKILSYFINKLSESLLEVEFVDVKENTLGYIKKPLVNIFKVTFTGNFTNNSTSNLPLNELFPNLRHLSLNMNKGAGFDYYNCHMPHLQHVFFYGEFYPSDENINPEYAVARNAFENMIKKNSQIRSIHLYRTEDVTIRTINTFLPLLESLTIDHVNGLDSVIYGDYRFENITTFAIGNAYTSPENLHFPRLQTLRFHFIEIFLDKWLQFMNEHNHVSKLHLEYQHITDLQFQQLTANLYLVELTLYFDDKQPDPNVLTTNAIVAFLECNKQLQKLNIFNFLEYHQETLQEILTDEWDAKILVCKKYDHGVSFQRKVIY